MTTITFEGYSASITSLQVYSSSVTVFWTYSGFSNNATIDLLYKNVYVDEWTIGVVGTPIHLGVNVLIIDGLVGQLFDISLQVFDSAITYNTSNSVYSTIQLTNQVGVNATNLKNSVDGKGTFSVDWTYTNLSTTSDLQIWYSSFDVPIVFNDIYSIQFVSGGGTLLTIQANISTSLVEGTEIIFTSNFWRTALLDINNDRVGYVNINQPYTVIFSGTLSNTLKYFTIDTDVVFVKASKSLLSPSASVYALSEWALGDTKNINTKTCKVTGLLKNVNKVALVVPTEFNDSKSINIFKITPTGSGVVNFYSIIDGTLSWTTVNFASETLLRIWVYNGTSWSILTETTCGANSISSFPSGYTQVAFNAYGDAVYLDYNNDHSITYSISGTYGNITLDSILISPEITNSYNISVRFFNISPTDTLEFYEKIGPNWTLCDSFLCNSYTYTITTLSTLVSLVVPSKYNTYFSIYYTLPARGIIDLDYNAEITIDSIRVFWSYTNFDDNDIVQIYKDNVLIHKVRCSQSNYFFGNLDLVPTEIKVIANSFIYGYSESIKTYTPGNPNLYIYNNDMNFSFQTRYRNTIGIRWDSSTGISPNADVRLSLSIFDSETSEYVEVLQTILPFSSLDKKAYYSANFIPGHWTSNYISYNLSSITSVRIVMSNLEGNILSNTYQADVPKTGRINS
jgi:hypothetical protein